MKLPLSVARYSSALGCLCALLVLLGIAFRPAWLATYDLEWPYDYDLFRDAAFAQTIIHGHFPADAYYAGEQNWYNPLGPAMIGGIARFLPCNRSRYMRTTARLSRWRCLSRFSRWPSHCLAAGRDWHPCSHSCFWVPTMFHPGRRHRIRPGCSRTCCRFCRLP